MVRHAQRRKPQHSRGSGPKFIKRNATRLLQRLRSLLQRRLKRIERSRLASPQGRSLYTRAILRPGSADQRPQRAQSQYPLRRCQRQIPPPFQCAKPVEQSQDPLILGELLQALQSAARQLLPDRKIESIESG